MNGSTDLIVVGGGAAGLAAARTARMNGKQVTIISEGPLGGDCTFTGCVPSKSIIEASRQGVTFEQAFARAHEVVEHIAATENEEELAKEGITVLRAKAELLGSGAVKVDGKVLNSGAIVMALGAKAAVPPIEGLAEVEALTNDTIWDLTTKPASMVIVGGGAIGCELGQALAGLGVQITIVEMGPQLLGRTEPEAAQIVHDALTAAGVRVILGQGVSRVAKGANGSVEASVGNEVIAADHIMLATGRSPNTSQALADVGLDLDKRGFIVTKDDLSTSLSGVYAAGDVTGLAQFTHAADYMGRLATNNIFGSGRSEKFNGSWIPAVTFTNPEVASIGVTEAEAAKLKDSLVAELPLTEHDRALTADRTAGYIKLIAGPKPIIGHRGGGGQIIGATIVAPRAGEMIAEISLAMRTKMFAGRLAQAIHPYPTWSYGIQKAAGQFFTKVEGREARPAAS